MLEFLRSSRRRNARSWPRQLTQARWVCWTRFAKTGSEENFAIVGQDCIPEVLNELRNGTSAIIGSISHEAESYGPRLIQLGIASCAATPCRHITTCIIAL